MSHMYSTPKVYVPCDHLPNVPLEQVFSESSKRLVYKGNAFDIRMTGMWLEYYQKLKQADTRYSEPISLYIRSII